jgi:hypothetical protein
MARAAKPAHLRRETLPARVRRWGSTAVAVLAGRISVGVRRPTPRATGAPGAPSPTTASAAIAPESTEAPSLGRPTGPWPAIVLRLKVVAWRAARHLVRRNGRLSPNLGLGLLGAFLILAGFLGAVAMGPVHGRKAADATVRGDLVDTAGTTPNGNASGSVGAISSNLPPATSTPAGASSALADAPPLAGRENFAFAPYWTLPQSGGFDLTGLSTLAYFSIGVNPNGTLDESGPGWNGYESQALSDLITRAHAAGERVVLTVNDFGQSSLDELTSLSSAPTTLAGALIPALQAKNFDGVNFDFEGEGSQDQTGLTHLVTAVSGALKAADPHWQVTMDTYASSAGDAGGFYNIPALAPAVDAFFVMAYEMNLSGSPSAASPLTSGAFSDLTTLQQYTAAVPASKVILGTPFFGIDWPTSDGTMRATADGPAADIPDSQAQGHGPTYWDSVTGTGWTSYEAGSQWHESYFESPYALYDVAQLATHYGVRGVGIWALGMESDQAEMIAALDGAVPPEGSGGAGPSATSASPASQPVTMAAQAGPGGQAPSAAPHVSGAAASSPPPSASSGSSSSSGSGTSSTTAPPSTTSTTAGPAITGVFDGVTRELTAVAPGSVDGPVSLGTLTDFSTTDPAYACLAEGPPLAVYLYGTLSGYDVAVASAPTDCITQEFIFHS